MNCISTQPSRIRLLIWLVCCCSLCILAPPLSRAVAGDIDPQPIALQSTPIEMSYVPEQALLGILMQPGRVLSSPEFESAPIEVLRATGLQEYGIDPLDISQVLMLVSMVVIDHGNYQERLPFPAVVVRLHQPYSLEDCLAELHPDWAREEIYGRLMLRQDNEDETCYTMTDETTLLVGSEPVLQQILEQGTAPSSVLVERLSAAGDQHDITVVFDVVAMRPLFSFFLGGNPQNIPPGVPQPLAALFKLPELLEGVQFSLNLTGDRPSTLELIATNNDAAEELQSILQGSMNYGRDFFLTAKAQSVDSEDPVAQAYLAYLERISASFVDTLQPAREGRRLTLTYQPGPGEQQAMLDAAGMGIALATPAIFAARAAARRAVSADTMRQLNAGMREYLVTHGDFPTAGGPVEERPNLSWRVHLLPYLGFERLYEEFHLEEPWDSEHNWALLEKMPPFYSSPAALEDEPGHTHFQLVVGEGTLFDGVHNGPGAEDTFSVLLVETDTTVLWTKPDDWEFTDGDLLHDLGHLHGAAGFNALFGDGHVEFLQLDADPNMLRRILAPRAQR